MRALLSNAAYGILDYAAFPLGMIAVAPILIRNLGVAQYGVWTVTSAAVSIGGISIARLSYSVVPLALYIQLFRRLFGARSQSSAQAILNPGREER